ncbi:TenA family protein [Profundibacterium mesophilum]|uniref:Thiaminase n=1 Tax=Profundibacterium mesophilum KAUST100406-0324 TaxID=1037889 RepID=A0A921NTC0_9RHOB|nr:TenA family protein [Profundibacterium mesophilum]KAF0675160.1 thiaminase [Profundibacterium mesophilum KAUST100406-0324]
MSYGSVFAKLREANAEAWRDYTRHDFVAALGDGSLPRAAFLEYLVQDYLFLIQFSRAWALAVLKAETLDEMRRCAATVNALLNEEMRLHVETCAREGISAETLESAAERLETIAYTRFVLAEGHAGDLLDLLVALAPCVLGYGEIGARLAREGGPQGGGPYAEWIETYAGADYQGVCAKVAGLLDGAAARGLGPDPEAHPRWSALCARFGSATRLESAFWSMGLAARSAS